MTSETKTIRIYINKVEYRIDSPKQTGKSLKKLAGIPACDVLFLEGPCEDQVIKDDAEVVLRECDRLHSQPPANYGFTRNLVAEAGIDEERVSVHPQPGGWHFIVISGFRLPDGYSPEVVELLVKLPPLFPDAPPDMFWVRPAVTLANGRLPRSTTNENLLGGPWQRFSWHLVAGAWKPGSSTFRDFMRCVHGRLLRRD